MKITVFFLAIGFSLQHGAQEVHSIPRLGVHQQSSKSQIIDTDNKSLLFQPTSKGRHTNSDTSSPWKIHKIKTDADSDQVNFLSAGSSQQFIKGSEEIGYNEEPPSRETNAVSLVTNSVIKKEDDHENVARLSGIQNPTTVYYEAINEKPLATLRQSRFHKKSKSHFFKHSTEKHTRIHLPLKRIFSNRIILPSQESSISSPPGSVIRGNAPQEISTSSPPASIVLEDAPQVISTSSPPASIVLDDAARKLSNDVSREFSTSSPPASIVLDDVPQELTTLWDQYRDSFQCNECLCSYMKNRQSIRFRANCTYRYLDHIPELPIATVQVNASRNKISSLNQSAILKVKNLLDLSLRHNAINKIVVTKEEASDVQVLDLGFNRLENLPINAFSFFPNLRNLSLQANLLKHVRNGTFGYLTKLRVLDLSFNKITLLEASSFDSLVALRELYLYRNVHLGYAKHRFPPAVFDKIKNLRVLCIQGMHNGETEYPLHGLAKLKNLRHLNIDIVASPEFLGPEMLGLKLLTTLEFGPRAYCYYLKMISSDFFQYVPYIQVLSFYGCKFHGFDPAAFAKMPNLKRLSITNIATYSLQQAFQVLRGLQNSSLEYLRFAFLSHEGEDIPCVSLNGSHAQYLTNLSIKELDLSGNRIAFVRDDFIRGLPKSLQSLVLAENSLTMKGAMWNRIYPLENLVKLDVSYQNQVKGEEGSPVKDAEAVLREASFKEMAELTENDTDINRRTGTTELNLHDDLKMWNAGLSISRKIMNYTGQNLNNNNGNANNYTDDIARNSDGDYFTVRFYDGYENSDDINHENEDENDQQTSQDGPYDKNITCNNTNKKGPCVEDYPSAYSVQYHIKFPKSLRYVKASHYNHFGNFPFQYYISSNNVQYLSLSNSLLTEWGGGTIPLMATHVDLSHNYCQHLKRLFFQPNNSLVYISMSSNLLGRDFASVNGGHFFTFLSKTKFMDISMNFIYELPYTFLKGLTSLETLRMTDNSLQALNLSFLETPRIRMIDARQNSISWISKQSRNELDQIAARHPVVLAIVNNPISCTCDGIDTIKWMSNTNVHLLDRTLLKCRDDHGQIRQMGDLSLLHKTLQRKCSDTRSLVISCSVSISFFVCLVVVYYIAKRYRWWLYVKFKKNVLFAKWFGFIPKLSDRPTKTYRYDAYLCYTDKDRKLAIEIADKLEKTNNSLFIPDLHILYGTNEVSGITSGVTNSYKFLIVLTENFEECLRTDFRHSGWLEYAINAALFVERSDRRDMLHVLQFSPVSTMDGKMPLYLARVLQESDRQTTIPIHEPHASEEALNCVWDSVSVCIGQPETDDVADVAKQEEEGEEEKEEGGGGGDGSS